jgi:hypothetical protein
MTNVRKWFFSVGALLATSFALPTAAQPQTTTSSEPSGMSPNDMHYASGYLAIGEDYYEGRSSKAELDARVAEMHRNRSERRKEHLEGLKARWGATLLNHPGARELLRINGRREAYLARALFLAHTDPSIKDRAKLVARIQGIIDTEEERHAKAMEALQSTPVAAAPRAPAAASSANAGGK